ncbi:N-6 DNA methylase [Cumulibacter manganitolerans]|uniref:N-6 DNA methylase n=1 Tax=Cumulibacter manganitolerans TaxID=1884992 RepID=UPI0012979802|nr:N-6 DNA methylase [Cumulibacter manganitolerans]
MSSVIDTPALRKARGAFFTPRPIADYIAAWALAGQPDSILEPSCGEAEFLHAAGAQAAAAGREVQLRGVELHPESARRAEASLAAEGIAARIVPGDFFDMPTEPRADAVIGNPPFVRYQDHAGSGRAKSRAAAAAAGVELSELASMWAAFTIHATGHLNDGGKLGLVLPAELLTVNYAAPVREYLLTQFATVQLVVFAERVFPDALEEVVLVLASGYRNGPSSSFELFQTCNAATLATLGEGRIWQPDANGGRWMASLLSPAAAAAYDAATTGPLFATLHDWGETSLGAVTGNNKYFAMTADEIRRRRLPATDYVPLSPPGSRHLRALDLTRYRLDALRDAGAATYLFRPAGEPSKAALRKIKEGERDGVHQAYKCTVRTPWWRTPLLAAPDIFVTYMNSDTPALATNSVGVHHLNSVHGLYLHEHAQKDVARELLPLAALNSLTALGAEIVGRAYGGGLLKLEPREADRLPVPGPDLLADAADALRAIKRSAQRHLREGHRAQAVALVDDALLIGALGISEADLATIQQARELLGHRRVTRGKKVAP